MLFWTQKTDTLWTVCACENMPLYTYDKESYIAHSSTENSHVSSNCLSILVKHTICLLCAIFAGIFPEAIWNFPMWIQLEDWV